MSRRAPLLTALAAVVYSTTASAHGGDDHSIGHAALRNLAGMDISVLSFDHGRTAGTLTTVSVRGEIAMGRWVAGVSLPYHHLVLKDRDDIHGVGDPTKLVKYQLIRMGADGLSLQIGTRVTLPLGAQHDGLGAGHYEVSPFVSAMGMGARLSWHGTLGLSESISSHSHDPSATGSEEQSGAISSSPVTAHANRELMGHLGATLVLGEHWLANAIVEGRQPLSDSRWETSVVLMPELGWASHGRQSRGQMRTIQHGWLVTLGSAHMVLGQRFDHRASFGMSRRF